MSFNTFKKLADNKLKFGIYMLMKLPSAWICGVRLRELEPNKCVVSVPYKWLSQNPFNSIYFACQAMAAEMTTGMLAMGHLDGRKPAVSMLITGIQAAFVKKASSRIYFTCKDGFAILAAIEEAVSTGKGVTITASSTGETEAGETVSSFLVTWSFKPKQA